MFAPFIAEELEIGKIIVPSIPPGVFSAWGMLNTDVRHSTIFTHITRLDAPDADATLNKIYGELEAEIHEVFRSEGLESSIIERYADIRYYGQEHTVRIPISSGALTKDDLNTIIESFHQAHEREYAFRLTGALVEIVNYQVVGMRRVKKLELSELPEQSFNLKDALLTERNIYINGGYETIPIYDRTILTRETILRGPAVLEDPTATIIVLHNQKASVDKFGNLIITR